MFVSQFGADLSFTDAEVSTFAEYLRILEGEETAATLRTFLAYGAGAVERQTRRIAKKRSFTLTFAAENEREFTLPLFPVRELSSASLDGVSVTGALLRATAGGWKVVLPVDVSGELTLTLFAGYDSTFPAPPELTAAVFAIAADLYEHRETQSERTLSENKTVRDLIARLVMPEV